MHTAFLQVRVDSDAMATEELVIAIPKKTYTRHPESQEGMHVKGKTCDDVGEMVVST